MLRLELVMLVMLMLQPVVTSGTDEAVQVRIKTAV